MSKYATFSGRATRSEYWWFYLFTVLMSSGSSIAAAATFEYDYPMVHIASIIASNIVSLALITPIYAAGSRRLHDIGKSGWWQLLYFIPIIGWILITVWLATDTKEAGDKYN